MTEHHADYQFDVWMRMTRAFANCDTDRLIAVMNEAIKSVGLSEAVDLAESAVAYVNQFDDEVID